MFNFLKKQFEERVILNLKLISSKSEELRPIDFRQPHEKWQYVWSFQLSRHNKDNKDQRSNRKSPGRRGIVLLSELFISSTNGWMESAVEPNLAHELGKKCKWNELEITTWRVKMCFKLLLKGNTFSAKTQIKRNGMGKCRKRDSQRKRISALLEIKITHTQRITKMLKSARKCTKKEIAFNTLDTHKSELEKAR